MRRRTALAAVAAAFVVSRVVLALVGVRYDISLMPWYWQLLDLDVLRHHLAQSVWNLHSQPPLFNLAVGVALKLVPHHVAGAFHALFLALGLTAALALEVLLERLGFARSWATALAVVVSCAPFWLVYENWLYYEYPVMTLLVVASLAFDVFFERAQLRWGVTAFSLMAIVIYIRTSFQIIWLFAFVAMILFVRRDMRRTILRAAAVPVVVVLLLYGKNAVMFGVPSTTSWFGMNLARITLWIAPEARLEQLVAEKKLPRIALVKPFAPLAAYRGELPPTRHTGVRALDRAMKANGGENLNALPYVALSRRYLRASLDYIRWAPLGYAKGVGKAAGKLSVPATDYSYVYPERDRIRVWDRVFNSIVYWRTPWFHGIGFGLVLMYLGGVIWGLGLFLRSLRDPVVAHETATILFIWITVVNLLLIGSLTDFGENERVHLSIDPLVLILALVGGRELLQRRRRAHGRRAAS